MKTAREINNYKPKWAVREIENKARKFKELYGKQPVIGILGLAYKPDIDDLRESPSIEITRVLADKNYSILVAEPHIEKMEGFNLQTVEHVLSNADIIVILVAHSIFRNIRYPKGKMIINFTGKKV